jgi:1-acyl-sn-glycerol-3-phosphate acyltransferase
VNTDLPPGSWPRLHDLARWIGTWLFLPLFRLRVYHRGRIPASGPVVLVANHSAFVDGPLLFGLLRRRAVFLVKQEMFDGPLGPVLPLIGQLAVRRGEPDRRPLMAAVAVLRAGGLVGVFPEGTRGSGEVAAAQHGAAWLARTTGAVVPAGGLPGHPPTRWRRSPLAAARRCAGRRTTDHSRWRGPIRPDRRHGDRPGRTGRDGPRTR